MATACKEAATACNEVATACNEEATACNEAATACNEEVTACKEDMAEGDMASKGHGMGECNGVVMACRDMDMRQEASKCKEVKEA